MNTWSPDKARAAYRFAAEAHRGQFVPGTDGLPYLMHVGMVAMEIMRAHTIEPFEHPDVAIQAAFLHDVVEDTDTALSVISTQFGEVVAGGVAALTKNTEIPKSERMLDSLIRIKRLNHEIWAVKLADRITNMHQPPDRWSSTKRIAYRKEAYLICAELGASHAYLRNRLEKKITEYAQFIAG